MLTRRLRRFIELEASGGIILLGVLFVVILIANSPLAVIYKSAIDIPLQVRIGTLNFEQPMYRWVNEGLMAIFFMLLGLEIKREILEGDLSDGSQLALPMIAAVGGICVPALIYSFVNQGGDIASHGWPIPTTTDIAFSLAVVAMLGKRVPGNVKVFLVALSIVDDILAILIIAVFYSGETSPVSLTLASIGIAALLLFNKLGITRLGVYMVAGVFIWACVIQATVNTSIAGVIVGLSIPLHCAATQHSPLRHLENALHPWVAYFILPLFVFVNGGISFANVTFGQLLTPVPLGIAMGLFIGKTLGVFSVVFIVVKLGFSKLPQGASWPHMLGISALTGIGFTMSFFFAALIFGGTEYADLARQGVLFGSILSATLGISIFMLTKR